VHEVASLLIEPSETRDRLTSDMYLPGGEGDPMRILEAALEASIVAEPIEARIREAEKGRRFAVQAGEDRAAAALDANVITADELALLRRAKRLVDQVIRVDDFPADLGASESRPAAPSSSRTSVDRKAAA
jgi:acyl-CoA dehydrogenase